MWPPLLVATGCPQVGFFWGGGGVERLCCTLLRDGLGFWGLTLCETDPLVSVRARRGGEQGGGLGDFRVHWGCGPHCW